MFTATVRRAVCATLLAAGLNTTALAAAMQPARAQVLEIATDQSPVGLDPHVATAFSTALITSTIYEGLTAIDKDLHVVPALAASWTISPDGLTYTFRLRRGAAFHSGRDVTAQDIIANIGRVRDPKTASPFASRLMITLDAPSAPFLVQLASLAIADPNSFAALGRRPDGTGPFRFRDWVPDTYIALERHPAYWDKGLPYLSGLQFNIVPESATREAGIASGTYRLLPSLDGATAAALAGKPGVKLLEVQDLAYSLVGVNTSKPPFDKPEVREALNLAIDRAQLVQAAYYGRGVPGGPLSPALTHWALPVSDFPCYRPDPAAAKRKAS